MAESHIDLSGNVHSTCICCGCHDMDACINEHTALPCYWVRLDRHAKIGVCSECTMAVPRWDLGDRSLSVAAKHWLAVHAGTNPLNTPAPSELELRNLRR